MTSTRCILPWIHQYGDIEGSYGLCCFTLAKKGSLFGKGKRPLDAFNDDAIKKARLDMLSGKKVDACSVCYDWEDQGIDSHRIRMNNKFLSYENLYNKTNPDGSVKNPPIYLDFRFGNLCNFSCRMCGSYASSSWVKEDKHFKRIAKNSPAHYDFWTNNDEFWEDIDKIKSYIKVLYFAGGEPFVQVGHYKLLQFLIDNKCTDIELSYNTNLSYNNTFKNYDIESMWSCFKKVELWPSIEGYKEKAEYGRKGLDWSLFVSNSKRFEKYISSFSIVSNIFSITSNMDLIKWIKRNNKNFSITNLVNPPHMSTTILSNKIKKQIINNYKSDLLLLYEDLSSYELNSILDSLKHMRSKNDSLLAGTFKKSNYDSDVFRGESFEKIYPELSEWYSNI